MSPTGPNRIMGIEGDVDGFLGAGPDRISGLLDDLLHVILLHLPCTGDAARTSVLSRRWRRVWTGIPKLSLRYDQTQPAAVSSPLLAYHDRVDAALAACLAPTVHLLEITMPCGSLHVPTARVSPWLTFASQRLAGELRLSLPFNHAKHMEEEVLLPLCDRVWSISFELNRTLRFQLLPTGAFMALASLTIARARVDGRELEAFLSSRCPRLKKLVLEWIALLRPEDPILSIRSDTLQRLEIAIGQEFEGRLEVVAPELQTFYPLVLCDFSIIASPKISEVLWYNYCYDPSRHRLAEDVRHLQRLATSTNSPAAALMQRFDTVNELNLHVSVAKGAREYEEFVQHMNELTSCDVLVVRFLAVKHSFKPTMLNLIRNCAGIRKLVVQLSCTKSDFRCKSIGCPCGHPEQMTNDIILDSLEEIQVRNDGETCHKVDLVRLLCKCSAIFQKRVAITVSETSRFNHMREMINSIQASNNNVEITVKST